MTTIAKSTIRGGANSRGGRLAGYDVVRVLLGLLLLTAATLKGVELATEPVANTSLLTSRWFLVIQVEFLFGLWLLSGLRPRAPRVLAIAVRRLAVQGPDRRPRLRASGNTAADQVGRAGGRSDAPVRSTGEQRQ